MNTLSEIRILDLNPLASLQPFHKDVPPTPAWRPDMCFETLCLRMKNIKTDSVRRCKMKYCYNTTEWNSLQYEIGLHLIRVPGKAKRFVLLGCGTLTKANTTPKRLPDSLQSIKFWLKSEIEQERQSV